VVAELIRFYMDQHFPRAASQGLRRHGVDVLTAPEARRCGLPYLEQLAFDATLRCLFPELDGVRE
jgi:hypothetical protein